jgi:hypothetical protein
MSATEFCKTPRVRAVLDEAHIGDIRGALGTIRHRDIAHRRCWWPRLRTLLAILGPGLIVMVGDNDADAFSTYTQAGQDYGTTLLWTLLASVLLPSATVFLLLLCNDHAVLGPWINGRDLTVFTGAVIAVLVMLSIMLTASVLFPGTNDTTILAILGGGMLFTLVIAAALLVIRREGRRVWTDSYGRIVWRMPPLDQLPPAQLTPLTRIRLTVLRGYLVIAGGLVFWRILELALSAG